VDDMNIIITITRMTKKWYERCLKTDGFDIEKKLFGK